MRAQCVDSTIHTLLTDQDVIQMPNLASCKACGPGWGAELTKHPPQHFVCTSCGEELLEEGVSLESWLQSVKKRLVFKEEVESVVFEETILRLASQKASKNTVKREISKFLSRRSTNWLIVHLFPFLNSVIFYFYLFIFRSVKK